MANAQRKIQSRCFADPFDWPADGPEETHGVGVSSEAIGGYWGMSWYEYYVDRSTAKVYRVRCSDGVNGGNLAHSYPDGKWLQSNSDLVFSRIKSQIESGATEVKVSIGEWIVMLKMGTSYRLDHMRGKNYAEIDKSIRDGLVGHLNGIPVIIDRSKPDELTPLPPLPHSCW